MGGSGLALRILTIRLPSIVAGLLLVTSMTAADPNLCDEPGEAPDLIVGALDHVQGFGRIDGVAAYAIGATSCNLGTCWADWFFSTPAHPVFAQNLFRLADGRFEQIGQSWVAHRFFALSGAACGPGCVATDGTHLGVDCSTSNSASATGNQFYLGPKSEVRAGTGSFIYPFTGLGETGNHIYKRLQVKVEDLDPALHPGALYFVEGQNVTADDAAAGNQHNNASHREVVVTPAGEDFTLNFVGGTTVGQPAVVAWATADPGVLLEIVDVPGDGRYHVASRATALEGGRWHYEYAVHNLDSDRSTMSVALPIPQGAGVTDLGFHDVDYHSGEPFDGSDWQAEVDTTSTPHAVVWATERSDADPDANALRWGTLYNFRFDADVPPVNSALNLVLFEPGVPSGVSVPAIGPRICDADGSCEPGEGHCNCATDCGAPPVVESECADGLDNDCDGLGDCVDAECCGGAECPSRDDDGDSYLACEDCDDSQAAIWSAPDEVPALTLQRNVLGWTLLSWESPGEPGCTYPLYEVTRSPDPADFIEATCLDLSDPTARTAIDTLLPSAGELLAYLVRAESGCPDGSGTGGVDSDGSPRLVTDCPQDDPGRLPRRMRPQAPLSSRDDDRGRSPKRATAAAPGRSHPTR